MGGDDDDIIICVSDHTNPKTKTHRYLIHQGTGESEKRQKSVFSENENVGSVWTVSPNAQDLVCVLTLLCGMLVTASPLRKCLTPC